MMHKYNESITLNRRNVLAAAGVLAIGVASKEAVASMPPTSNVINVASSSNVINVTLSDSTSLHTILSGISTDTTVIFEAGVYNLAYWSSRIDFTHSVNFIAPNGSVVLQGNPATDFVGFASTQQTGCFLMYGIQLNTWKFGLFITSLLTHADLISIENCQFVDVERGINGYINDPTVNYSQIESIKVINCEFKSSSSTSPIMNYGVKIGQTYSEASVSGCSFKNIVHTAVLISDSLGTSGAPSKDVSLNRLNTLIGNNHISNIVSDSAECHAVMIAGDKSVVSNNIIDTITTPHPASTGCEGIYLKCRNSIVTGNNLKNAGTNEAAIITKGAGWDEGSTTVDGYGTLISDNVIVFESSFLAPGGKTAGISLHAGQASVLNNYIEGASVGVKTGNGSVSDISICGNRIINFYLNGISLHIKRENYFINNNQIQSYNDDTSAIMYGVFVKLGTSVSSTKNIVVENNLISHGDSTNTNKYGISIYRPSSATVDILGATIIGNKIDGFNHGIFFNIKSPTDGNYTATSAFMKNNLIFNCSTLVSGLSLSQYTDSGNL